MSTTFNDNVLINADATVTAESATALTVARSGSNYGLQVDESAASAATGLKIAAAAAGSGLALSTISSGTNENLKVDAKGSGTVTVGGTSTGNVIAATGGGNVGVGTSSPGSKLDVKGELRLSGSTSGYVGLATAAAAGSTTYTLPSADGTGNQALTTNGSGTLAWSTIAAAPGGSNTQVQFNDSGAFAGDAGLTFNKTTDALSVGGALAIGGALSGVTTATLSDDLIFSANKVIRRNTTGSDTGSIELQGGGATGITRGGAVWVYGNAHSNGGWIEVIPGNASSSSLVVSDGSTQRLRIIASDGMATFTSSAAGASWIFNNTTGTNTYMDYRFNGTSTLRLGVFGASTDGLISTPNGNLYISIATGTKMLPTSDNAFDFGDGLHRWTALYAVNGTIQTSDLREKDVVGDSLGLDFIKALQPIAFRWKKDDGKVHYGLGAQDVLRAAPEGALVHSENPDCLGMNYAEFVAPLVKSVQELSGKLEAAYRTIGELSNRVQQLEGATAG